MLVLNMFALVSPAKSQNSSKEKINVFNKVPIYNVISPATPSIEIKEANKNVFCSA